MYKVLVDKRVEKQISSLHPHDQQKIIAAIDSLSQEFTKAHFNPKLKKLAGEPAAWRWRESKLRILFYRNKNEKLIRVYKVGYRGGVYN